MGCCFSFNKAKIKIIDETPEGENFNYSRSEGTITYSIERTCNIPLIEINFDSWVESSVCLCPKSSKARFLFLLLERTPPPSPILSSVSDSGVNTVF